MENWKQVLRPIAEQFAKSIGKLSDEQLQQLRVAKGAVTQTNCWWVEYGLAKLAGDIANNELQLRRPTSPAQAPD